MKKVTIVLVLLLLFAVWGCGTRKQEPNGAGIVRICSSMNRNISEALINGFANKTGIVVD